MNTMAVTVVALGTGMQEGAVAVLGMGLSEVMAALGAFAVATLGVLVVRILNSPTGQTRVAVVPPFPENGGLKRAA